MTVGRADNSPFPGRARERAKDKGGIIPGFGMIVYEPEQEVIVKWQK